MKPHIKVVAAAIVREGKVLALRRAVGDESVIHKLEFVGGKVEEGETPEQALIRECKEELALDIEVGELLNTIDYEYPKTTVTLSVYFVKPLSDYEVKEHEEEAWLDCVKLDSDEWAPADKGFVGILKNGYVRISRAKTVEDYEAIHKIAEVVMHETYDGITPEGQVSYMLNMFLTPEVIGKNITESGYTYKLIYLNGEAVGFFAFCPANAYDGSFGSGTFLSKMYIKKFARGKKITSKVLAGLSRPVYLTVKKDNNHAVNIYKHYGFKILQSVVNDIGSGYVMDDFVMTLTK